jgi:hypothetical protein
LQRNESGSSTLERHAETAVVRLLRQQRLAKMAEDRAGREDQLKRRLWQAKVDARKRLREATAEAHVPEISRWRAEGIEQAHDQVQQAKARLAERRFARRGAKELAAAQAHLHELLARADLDSYEAFRAKIEGQSETAREERIARAKAELAIAEAAWDAYEAGRHPESDVIDLRR